MKAAALLLGGSAATVAAVSPAVQDLTASTAALLFVVILAFTSGVYAVLKKFA